MKNTIEKINQSLLNLENKVKINKIILSIVFLVLISIVFFQFDFKDNLPKRPRSVHSWAQCMRASIAKNYAEEDMNFFKPRLHNVLGGEGITGMEFPLVNYIVAIFYKLFGFNEVYFRGFVCLTMFIGLYFFYVLSFSLLKNLLLAILVTGLSFFSPVLVYYSTNFMPDVPSLAMVLISWYCFFRYINTKEQKHIIWLFALLTLAGLIKITSLISFGVIICLIVLDSMGFFNKEGSKLILHKKQFLFAISLGFIAVFGWYKYAQWLSEAYGSNAFTLGSVMPKNMEEATKTFKAIRLNWEKDYFNPTFYNILGGMLLALIVFIKFVNRLLFAITVLLILGSSAFIYLMFLQFKDHDYYIVPLMVIIFFLMLTFFDMLINISTRYFMPLKYIGFLFFCMVFMENYSYAHKNYEYRQSDYYIEATKDDYRMFYNLEPKLRALGIKKHDITLVGPDFTFSNSLYLMNQVGYQFPDYGSAEYISIVLEKLKPRILIVRDYEAFNKAYPNNLSSKIIAVENGLTIYKLY